jgi:LytS/YehU family sensor histidine kinase
MNAKQTAFVAMMAALGTLLSGISINMAPLLAVSGQGGAALDLSHIATFIAAIFGGPYIGAIVGFLSGIYAGYYFGYVMGSLGLLSLVGLPFGKALTGLVAGFLYKKMGIGKSSQRSSLAVFATLVSYVPESVYTVLYFLYLAPFVVPFSMAFMIPMVIPKGWIEIIVMSLFMGALAGNAGFKEFINRFLQISKPESRLTRNK